MEFRGVKEFLWVEEVCGCKGGVSARYSLLKEAQCCLKIVRVAVLERQSSK